MGFRDSLLDGRRDLWDSDGLLLEVFEKGVHFADHDAMAALVTKARRWVEWMFGMRQMWELGGGSALLSPSSPHPQIDLRIDS